MISWAFLAMAILGSVSHALAAPVRALSVTSYRGTFADGATYVIQTPSNWNGVLVLFSHGYVVPGQPNPASDVSDAVTGNYLLSAGYALAGSSYAAEGWAVQSALPDQLEVLDTFARVVGTPKATIAWGFSMGGLITAGLIQQYPARFNAALPMCGAVGGAVGTWNSFLDAAFAFNTLLAQSRLQVVGIANPAANLANALSILGGAQKTAAGRARIALAAALADVPGWFAEGSPAPRATDYTTREKNQFLWFKQQDFAFSFDLRADLESKAGGNPSWNAGIDYRAQLAASADLAEVKALYTKSGLNLENDLSALDAAATIAADPSALAYASDNIILNGQISVPVLTLQTEGDGIVANQSDSAYAAAVGQAGDGTLLGQVFVARAGHCAFTPGEMIAAFGALVARLNTGSWNLAPASLNAVAAALGSSYNPYPPSFAPFTPGPYLRTDNGNPPRSETRRRLRRSRNGFNEVGP